jgi:hypothetical protein
VAHRSEKEPGNRELAEGEERAASERRAVLAPRRTAVCAGRGSPEGPAKRLAGVGRINRPPAGDAEPRPSPPPRRHGGLASRPPASWGLPWRAPVYGPIDLGVLHPGSRYTGKT